MTIDIPCKPHVRNYLQYHWGHNNYKLSYADPIATCLHSLLLPKPTKRLLQYNHDNVFTAHLNVYQDSRRRYWLTPVRARLFNAWVTRLMYQELYSCITLIKQIDGDAKTDPIIRQFEKKYGLIGTSLAFETLKKRFYRGSKSFKELEQQAL